ncbi:MAG TPA: M28 family peptidase [Candidatus Luteimonas excrementigallinarum]|nr:M28 family peptidase [Candidatus Luteimonas excrementigallinarum]
MPISLLAAALALTACGGDRPATDTGADTSTDTAAATHEFSPEITEADFREMTRTLSSDEFEGRAPGSPGGEKTVEYISAQFERIGLQPAGDNDSWYQTVPMVQTTASDATVLRVAGADGERELKFGSDMMLGTRTGQQTISVNDSELVFVGYGVDAPERDWNDYEGLDVKGKTVVMLVNDPGFHVDDAELFDGNRMTYYGRWTYKFEEAARKGAEAALIIHDTAGASYGWDVVRTSWSGAQFDLRAEDDPAPRLPAQGWITNDVARELFANAGLDLDEQIRAASSADFKPVPLQASVSFELESEVVESSSRNVIGVLPGTEKPEEVVVYMGHWDHLGKHDDGQIYSGAIDNATGIAGIIEIAERFANTEPAPKRSVAFLAVTLEESGLLGSQYYVAHPAFPLENTVAAINLDAMSVAGPSRDFVVTGMGNSELEDILEPIASAQGRTLVEEGNPAGGFYFRSDHFNFAKAGVPALYAKGGNDLVDGGTEGGRLAGEDYATRYHQPSDVYRDEWNLDGLIQDLEALYDVGRVMVDDVDQWPNWYEGNPFKAARDGMMDARD